MRLLPILRILFPILFAGSLLGAPANVQVDTKTHALSITDGQTVIDAKAITLTLGGFTIYDGAGVKTIILGSTSGTQIGAVGDKIHFFGGGAPIVRPIGTTDLRVALINLGLYTAGGASPLNLNGGAFTSGPISGDNETLSGTLGVTGNSTFGGTVGVTGAISGSSISLSGNESVGGTLTITGATSGLSLTLSGNGLVGGTFGVSGASALNSISGTNETLSGTLGVTGNTTFGGTVGITGAVTAPSLALSGNETIGGTLGITGATSGAAFSFTGNGTIGGTLGVTGATALNAVSASDGTFSGYVSGALRDKGGAVYNVVAYGGVADGITDNLPFLTAVISAIDANGGYGTIEFPAGFFYFSSGFILKGEGKNIRGAGREATFLTVASAAPYVIQFGDDSYFLTGKISGVNIRHAGTPAPGTIGINALNFSNCVIEDVSIHNHDIGIKLPNAGIGLALDRVSIHGNLSTGLWIKDAAAIYLDHCEFGTVDPAPTNALIQFEGGTNDIRLKTCQLFATGINTTAAFKWINTTTEGYYRFDDINIENVHAAFQSASSALTVSDLEVSHSRLTPDGKLFDFNAATVLSNIAFHDNINIGFTTPSTIAGATKSQFSGNDLNGGLTFSGGSWTVRGNTFRTDVVFTGAFNPLVIANNMLAFNGSIPIHLVTSAATGPIMNWGNGADAGTPQPESVLPANVTGSLKGTTAITACAYRSADLSIPDSTLTAIPFNVERWDTDSMHSTSSNTTRFTATTAGYYSMSGTVRFAANGTGQRKVLINANGGAYIATQTVNANASNPIDVMVARASWYMAAGDYVELVPFQSSGGSLTAETASGVPIEFSIARIP